MVSSTSNTRAGSFPLGPNAARRSSRGRSKVPCGRIWPNGEFGLSWQYKDEEIEAPSANCAGGVSLEHMRLMSLVLEFEREYLKAVARAVLYPWLVKSPKSSQRPETYGRKGITGYGQKVVRSGCHLLQRKYGKGRLSFLTLTLPDLPPSDLEVIALGWADLVRQLMQHLKRRLERQGLPPSIVLVTELQPKRLKDGSQGCLHVHAVFVGRHRRQRWLMTPQDIRGVWLRLLSRKVGFPVYSDSCENIQRVEKSAENYLSKYMSKGAECIAEYADKFGWQSVPRQWWSASSAVKNAVKKYTISGEQSSKILDALLHNYWKKGGIPDTDGVVFSRPITVPITEHQDLVIGYFGKIDQSTYQDIYDLSVSYRDSIVSVW